MAPFHRSYTTSYYYTFITTSLIIYCFPHITIQVTWLVVTEVTAIQRTSYLCVRLLRCASSIFHHRVCYRVLSMHYVCTMWRAYSTFEHHPHLWATLVPNFVSVAPSIAELACGKNFIPNHSLTHAAYLMPWELKLLLRNTEGNYKFFISIFIWSLR